MATNITLNSSNVTEVKYKKGSTTTDITEIKYKKGSSGTATSVWTKQSSPTLSKIACSHSATYNGVKAVISITLRNKSSNAATYYILSVEGSGTPVFCGSLGAMGSTGCSYYEVGDFTRLNADASQTITVTIPKNKIQTSDYTISLRESGANSTTQTYNGSFGFEIMQIGFLLEEAIFEYDNNGPGNTYWDLLVSDEESFDGEQISVSAGAFRNGEFLDDEEFRNIITHGGYMYIDGRYQGWYGDEEITFKIMDLTLLEDTTVMFTTSNSTSVSWVCKDYTTVIDPLDVTASYEFDSEPVQGYITDVVNLNITNNNDFVTSLQCQIEIYSGTAEDPVLEVKKVYTIASGDTLYFSSGEYALFELGNLKWIVTAFLPGIINQGITEGTYGNYDGGGGGDETTTTTAEV